MIEYRNCGACGDRIPLNDTTHTTECYVIAKVQTQENILETCCVCFEPFTAPHWRCEELRRLEDLV